MVLTDDNFATIVKAVENGRNIYQNIKNAIQFLLSGNFAAILAVLYASLASLPVPFAPVHLLFIRMYLFRKTFVADESMDNLTILS